VKSYWLHLLHCDRNVYNLTWKACYSVPEIAQGIKKFASGNTHNVFFSFFFSIKTKEIIEKAGRNHLQLE